MTPALWAVVGVLVWAVVLWFLLAPFRLSSRISQWEERVRAEYRDNDGDC